MWNIGKKHSEKSINKMKESKKISWRRNPIQGMTGQTHSEKTKLRMKQTFNPTKIKKGQHIGKKTEFKKGALHPCWKGGKVPFEQIERNKYEMYVWRLAVFQRDNYTCQNCGKRGGTLEAHHIYSFRNYPEYRFLPWNGQTLCKRCHRQVHTKMGKGFYA